MTLTCVTANKPCPCETVWPCWWTTQDDQTL